MPKAPLEIAKEALAKALETERRNKAFLSAIGPAIRDSLEPFLDGLKNELRSAFSNVKIDAPQITVNPEVRVPDIHVPEIQIPDIHVPEPKVTVNIPPIKIPEIRMPDEMEVRGWLNLIDWDKRLLERPIPVQLRDAAGNPMKLFENLTSIAGGGGGGFQYPTIAGFSQSAYSELMNADGRLKVSVESGNAGLTDAELRASSVPVSQVSGSIWSVSVTGSTTTSVGLLNSDGATIDPRDRNWTVTETVPISSANTLDVKQVSGANWSVTATATDLDIRDLVNASDSVSAYQVSGHNWSVYAQDALTTVTATTIVNADNRIRVSVETGGSGLTDSELRASSVPVEQVSGSTWSVSVNDSFRTTVVSNLINSDDRLRVSVETGGSGLTDSELRATAVPVSQVSGAEWSVSVNDSFRTTVTSTVINSDNRLRVSLETGGSGLTDAELRVSSVPVEQVSGSNWSVSVTNTVPVSATDLDIRNLANATDLVSAYQVSGHRWSTEATQSGTWTVALSGSLTSTVAVGPTVADAADDGNAPIQIGGIARTANPTAVAANDVVKSTHDDLGRQLVRPVQVRDLVITAYASLTNGTETTLLAASAGSFHDLIYVLGANNSDAAVTVDIRPVTAGNIVMSIQIPANGTAGVSMTVPYPQSGSDTGNNWTADMGDITGTTVYLSALFSREV